MNNEVQSSFIYTSQKLKEKTTNVYQQADAYIKYKAS